MSEAFNGTQDDAHSASNSAWAFHAGAGNFADAFYGLSLLVSKVKAHYDALAAIKPPGFKMPEFIGFKKEDGTFSNDGKPET